VTEPFVPAVLGTETEFGITVRNHPDFNPVVASSMVINSYAGAAARIQWSFEEESPERDARGFGYEPPPPADYEAGLVNVVLGNGARFYVDHAHPEYSTPECIDARQAALHDKAGELVMARAVMAAAPLLGPGQTLFVLKNNSDGKGNSYGSHENYLVPRSVPFSDLVRHLTGFFVSRQVFTGAGKVGGENGRPPVDYQITQRADFFEEEVGLETTLKRPIINTRDEPHADPTRYRRLHVIVGDANLSEVQILMKLGVTSVMLAAISAGSLGPPVMLEDPVDALWRISHDPTLQAAVRIVDGGTVTALDLQWHYFEWLAKHVETHGTTEANLAAMSEWESVLGDLERDPALTIDRLDWTAKLSLLEAYRERDGLRWTDPKLRMLDLQYHDVDRDRGLHRRLTSAGRMRRLFGDDEVHTATMEPPAETRAWFRGRCVDKYGDAIVAANWDSLIFDAGEESLRRVPMMDPLRGTRRLTAELLERAPHAADLIQALEDDTRR
jgi:proteasome accessory factor A